jgi:hypothetical protein
MADFLKELEKQRWDDHRFYHHSRINQSLHLISAISFVCAYVLLFINPIAAAMLGWLVSMVTRQSGHFFFEPKGYDEVNQVTNEYKEEIKVGYNIKRKIVLLAIWALSPLLLVMDPSLFGLMTPHTNTYTFVYNVSVMWIWLGALGLLFRTVHLFFIMGVQSGLVWMTKILTDPFHDIMLYYRSPLYVLRGELIAPRPHA